jgi:hypothetical protein
VLSTAEIGATANLGTSLAGIGAAPLPDGCPRQQPTSSTPGGSSSSSSASGLLPSLLTLEYRVVNSIGPQPAAAMQVGTGVQPP